MSTEAKGQRSPRPCPVCESTGPRTVLHQQRFFEGPLGDGYDVVVCDRCGAGFADGIPTQAVLDRYYAERSKYTYSHNDGAESPYDLKRFEKIADQIESHLPNKAARILDIGCATGGLLAELKKRGYQYVVGSDPSPACAIAARKLYDLDVRTAALSEHVAWTGRFDAVLLVGVLEHLRDALPAVRAAARLLHSGGLLYCAQPDVETFAECKNAPYQQFSVEHVNFFSAASLSRMMDGAGLAVRQIWNWNVEWRAGMTDSVVSGVFARRSLERKGASPSAVAWPSSETRIGLDRYLERCLGEDQRLRAVIQQLVSSGEQVLVWGAGTLTRRLLAMTSLRDVQIVAFVDANPHVRERLLIGRPVLAPEEIGHRNETIFVCSKPFEGEISEMIRGRLKLTNRLILLP